MKIGDATVITFIILVSFIVLGSTAPLVAGFYNITISTDTMTFSNSTALMNLTQYPSWDNFTELIIDPYENSIGGGYFYVFLFSIPIFMICIRQENIVLGLVTGVVMSVSGYAYIPAEFRYITVLIVAVAFTFITYTVFKSRK